MTYFFSCRPRLKPSLLEGWNTSTEGSEWKAWHCYTVHRYTRALSFSLPLVWHIGYSPPTFSVTVPKVPLRKPTSTLTSLLTRSIEVLRKRKVQSQNNGLCSDNFPSCRNLLLSQTHIQIYRVSILIGAISHYINKLQAHDALYMMLLCEMSTLE